MHVLYVDHTSSVSGAQRALLDLLDALPPSIRPTVMCPEGQLADMVRERGIPVTRFVGTSGSFRFHPLYTAQATADVVRSAVQLVRAAHALGTDVVHANSIRAGVMTAVARRLGAPPTVVHVHDALPGGRVATVVRRVVCSGADALITISDYTTRNFSEGRPSPAFRMLHNPLDLSRFDPERMTRAEARRRLGLPAGAPVVGIVAQITPWKGQDTAIEAVNRLRHEHPDIRLLVVGSPKFVDKATRFDNLAFEQGLRDLVGEYALHDHVEFWPEREDVEVVVRALDVMVAPSWEEPFGRSIIEAMAAGTPVAATNVGGPAEYIDDGVDGLLVPPRDPEQLAAAVVRLLRDRAAGERMAELARAKVVRAFDRNRYAQRVADVYDDVFVARPGRGQLSRG